MKSKIAQNLSFRFFKNFGSKRDSPKQINHENFIISCTVSFRAILDQRQVFTTSDENWIAHALYLSALSYNAMYRMRERSRKLELFYRMFIKLFRHIFLALGLITCLNGVLKLSLHIPKRFDAFQVLKWVLLLLEVTCIIFACATNTDVWQAIIVRATKSRKNCSKQP